MIQGSVPSAIEGRLRLPRFPEGVELWRGGVGEAGIVGC